MRSDFGDTVRIEPSPTRGRASAPRYGRDMKIDLNLDSCIGSGSCEMLAPDVFEVGDDGYVALLTTPSDDRLEEIRAAATSCPTGVITVTA